jgi:transposase
MRKIKEVLRLRFELGLGQRQIARSCAIGLSTVHDYLERVAAAGISWPLPEGLSEEELEAKLFGNQSVTVEAAVPSRPQPDWKTIHEQLSQHRHLTLQLLWQEYRQVHPDGYRYSWFCERYQRWRRRLDVVLRQEHKAGEMFVDWAGTTIPVYDATAGEAWSASLFVAVLGASSYTYAEATRDQQLEAWIQAHIHALEFFGGGPTLAVPDNTKTAVTRACRYDPDLNPTYQDFAVHYGMGVVPARPYKPRDTEGAGTRSRCGRVEFPGTIYAAGGSAMELAREPGASTEAESRQAERFSLCGGHRLSSAAWPGQDCRARSGEGFLLGAQS